MYIFSVLIKTEIKKMLNRKWKLIKRYSGLNILMLLTVGLKILTTFKNRTLFLVGNWDKIKHGVCTWVDR